MVGICCYSTVKPGVCHNNYVGIIHNHNSLFDCDTGFFVECRPLNCVDLSFQVQSMLFDELFYD